MESIDLIRETLRRSEQIVPICVEDMRDLCRVFPAVGGSNLP